MRKSWCGFWILSKMLVQKKNILENFEVEVHKISRQCHENNNNNLINNRRNETFQNIGFPNSVSYLPI